MPDAIAVLRTGSGEERKTRCPAVHAAALPSECVAGDIGSSVLRLFHDPAGDPRSVLSRRTVSWPRGEGMEHVDRPPHIETLPQPQGARRPRGDA